MGQVSRADGNADDDRDLALLVIVKVADEVRAPVPHTNHGDARLQSESGTEDAHTCQYRCA